MHRGGGRWRHGGGIHLSKREQGERRWFLIISSGAGKFLGLRRIFARISPDFPEKFFVKLLQTNSLPQRSVRPFLVLPSKKVLMCFSANLGRHFLKSSNVGSHYYANHQGFYPDFQQIKTFGGALVSPPATRLLFITVS